MEDYTTQGENMQRKFEEKGYTRDLAMNAFLSNKNKQSKNKDNTSKEMENTARFVSTFNTKYRAISKIIYKYYNILDQYLVPLLPPKPQITFRRSHTIKNIIAPSKMEKSNKRPLLDIRAYFDNRTGIFNCRKRGCLTCKFISHGCSKIVTNKGIPFQIKQFIICSTEFVIYVLLCPCSLLYVGHMIRTLRTRVGEHRRFIKKGCVTHSVPRHFPQAHNKDFGCLKVFAIEAIPKGTLTDNERFSLLCSSWSGDVNPSPPWCHSGTIFILSH